MMHTAQFRKVVREWVAISEPLLADQEAMKELGWIAVMYSYLMAAWQVDEGPIRPLFVAALQVEPPWMGQLATAAGEPYFALHYTFAQAGGLAGLLGCCAATAPAALTVPASAAGDEGRRHASVRGRGRPRRLLVQQAVREGGGGGAGWRWAPSALPRAPDLAVPPHSTNTHRSDYIYSYPPCELALPPEAVRNVTPAAFEVVRLIKEVACSIPDWRPKLKPPPE